MLSGETLTLILNLIYLMSVLAMVTLGLAIIFGQLGVMNMAHGEFLTIGAYAMVATQGAGLPLFLGLPLAFVSAGAVGLAVQRLVVQPLRSRPLDTLLATWGVSILLRKLIEAIFGRQYKNVASTWAEPISLFGTPYPLYRLLLIALTLVFFAGLVAFYRRSTIGARLQAMVSNPVLAQAVGINVDRLSREAFVFASAITGLAGALLAPLVRIDPLMGMDYLMNSFFVMVVGGLGSLAGLFAGSAMVGATQGLIANLFDQTYGYTAVLIISTLFLWRRPHGLFARN